MILARCVSNGGLANSPALYVMRCQMGHLQRPSISQAWESSAPCEQSRILVSFDCAALVGMTQTDLVEVDAIGMACPMPLLKAKRALNGMATGQQLLVLATDQGSVRDFHVFAEQSGHRLLRSDEKDGVYRHLLQKC